MGSLGYLFRAGRLLYGSPVHTMAVIWIREPYVVTPAVHPRRAIPQLLSTQF